MQLSIILELKRAWALGLCATDPAARAASIPKPTEREHGRNAGADRFTVQWRKQAIFALRPQEQAMR
jgi:hypothetical protein